MISKSLSTSEKFSNLSATRNGLAEFCQVLYVMLIPHTDDFGKLQGDPFTVKHQCFPASPRSADEFREALSALHDSELIIWYSVSGKRFIQISNFEPHQTGLRKRTKSRFPEIPGNSGNVLESPGIDGKVPEIPPEGKGREEKGTEGKGTGTATRVTNTPTQPLEHSPAPIFGHSNPHKNHACCGKVCLHSTQFGQFERFAGSQSDPNAYVRAFFATWDDRYQTGDRSREIISDDVFEFWRNRWAETHPSAKGRAKSDLAVTDATHARQKAEIAKGDARRKSAGL